ncbi:hypothetical protein RhiirA4_481326 [Rhizophagus irregularis]|uniref:Uncharacterized protein n=1 Tax=Rhizophagus irregularis TaxID=588596 RepID=A0A2I1HJD0_9GLOM|nr:hypothetical protein RhiirA4_481326 [Rhizophagus irregularis]
MIIQPGLLSSPPNLTDMAESQKLLSLEKSFNEFNSTYIPSNPPSFAYTTRRSDLDNTLSRLRSILSRVKKKAFQRILVNKSTSRGKFDHSSFCPGSTRNSLSPEFTPPAVAPAFTPDNHQDGSPDMAAMESLLSDHYSQALPNISYEFPTDLPPQRRFENDDDEADFFSTYVPTSSATESPHDAACTANRLAIMLAELKTWSTSSSATTFRQAESFIDFDELLSVYNVPFLPCSTDNSIMIVDSDDRPYDFDDDSHFFLSSFDNSSLLSLLSESTVSLPIQPLSIDSFFEFSKFERRRKWKIYRSSLPPVSSSKTNKLTITWKFGRSFGLVWCFGR